MGRGIVDLSSIQMTDVWSAHRAGHQTYRSSGYFQVRVTLSPAASTPKLVRDLKGVEEGVEAGRQCNTVCVLSTRATTKKEERERDYVALVRSRHDRVTQVTYPIFTDQHLCETLKY